MLREVLPGSVCQNPYPPIEVGVCNGDKTYYLSFWDYFKVIEGHGSSWGVHAKIVKRVKNLLHGDFPEDF